MGLRTRAAVEAAGLGLRYPSGRRSGHQPEHQPERRPERRTGRQPGRQSRRSGRLGLAGLNLELPPGEVLGVMGPNGSGKTTLLRLLATDLRPGSGRLHLLGEPAVPSSPALRRRIAWAPAEAPFHPDLTGRENARLLLEVAGRYDGTTLDRWMRAFELHEVSNLPVSQYSFGMRRKLVLAEAFARSAELVLLDEPLSGLDPAGVAALRWAVRQAADRGAAVVYATNEARESPSWADRVLLLHRGERVASGTIGELLGEATNRTRMIFLFTDTTDDGTATPDVADLLAPSDRLVHADEAHLEIETDDDERILRTVLPGLLDRGARIQGIRSRPTHLGDLFRDLVGAPLDEEGAVGEAP